jgi:hypothetical protein
MKDLVFQFTIRTPDRVEAGDAATEAAEALGVLEDGASTWTVSPLELVLPTERRFALSEVKSVLNRAANLVADVHDGHESSTTIAQDDAVNLTVNAVGYLLEHPDATLDEIIPASYADVEVQDWELDEGEAVPEKGCPRWNQLVTAKVKGWLS